MVAVNVEALSCQLESIITEIQSLHDTMGVLIDDVADLGSTVHAAMLEVRAAPPRGGQTKSRTAKAQEAGEALQAWPS